MSIGNVSAVLAAGALTVGAAFALPAAAQTTQGGSSGGVAGRDVSASTYGSGQTTTTPTGSSIGVTGGGDATALNGGTASTSADAKLNERRAMQRAVARAQDDDERATSRTRTIVQQNGDVRSRTVSRYKEQGQPVVRESVYTVNGEVQNRPARGKKND